MFSGGLAILQDLVNIARPPKNILNKNFKVFLTNVKKKLKIPFDNERLDSVLKNFCKNTFKTKQNYLKFVRALCLRFKINKW